MVNTITFGGWYQRTTMHLSEVFQFLSEGTSKLDLDKDKLTELLKNLDIKKVERKNDYLEYIEAVTKENIIINYYEDGLYILKIEEKDLEKDLEKDIKKLKEYFDTKYNPAINYLFSLGAPTPKILANIKDDHPIVIGEITSDIRMKKFNEKIYGKIYSDTNSKDIRVLKTNKYIIVLSSRPEKRELSDLIEMQIFFKEFKSQLHKYLNIHRAIWEEISKIKEQKFIEGDKISVQKAKLESYAKTVSLISNRINQMGSYAKTRSSLSKQLGVDQALISHFQYKYEDLFNSLEYIKEIWKMTSDYVNSAIQILRDIEGKTTSKNLRSIQLLASIGVITGILGYLNKEYFLPKISLNGFLYLVSLSAIAFLLDWFLSYRMKKKKYELMFIERSKDI